MNFLADENIDRQTVDILRQNGHHVSYIADIDPGLTDEAVLEMASRESLLLITGDKDFGELVFRHGRHGSGIVLIRLPGLSPVNRAAVVASVVSRHAAELLQAFSVITPGITRIRHRNEPEAEK